MSLNEFWLQIDSIRAVLWGPTLIYFPVYMRVRRLQVFSTIFASQWRGHVYVPRPGERTFDRINCAKPTMSNRGFCVPLVSTTIRSHRWTCANLMVGRGTPTCQHANRKCRRLPNVSFFTCLPLLIWERRWGRGKDSDTFFYKFSGTAGRMPSMLYRTEYFYRYVACRPENHTRTPHIAKIPLWESGKIMRHCVRDIAHCANVYV